MEEQGNKKGDEHIEQPPHAGGGFERDSGRSGDVHHPGEPEHAAGEVHPTRGQENSGGGGPGGAGDADADARGPDGAGAEVVKGGPPPAVVQVEFKGERRGYFLNAKRFPIDEGDYVVVQVERGRDMGKVVRCGDVLDKIPEIRPIKQEVLRRSSDEDMRKWEENKRKEDEARRVCEDKIAAHGLKMKLVEVEYQLDGTKITFFFTADERVDFRELVKDLAGIYKTRIELRQIGVRDEAKRLGGYGSCGRKYCCTTFLQEFEPVTLRMARDQRLSLSPTKISGACGRLMCCLAYEREYYMEVAKQLPKVGRKLMTPYGEVTVTKIDIFAQVVIVEDENGEEMRLTLEQIRRASQAKSRADATEDAGTEGPVGGARGGAGGGRETAARREPEEGTSEARRGSAAERPEEAGRGNSGTWGSAGDSPGTGEGQSDGG